MHSLDAGFPLLNIILLLVAIGSFGGFVSGLLGVGGGSLFVPALVFTMTKLGVDPQHCMHIAVATSLLIVLATSITSATAHYRRGGVDIALCKDWVPYIIGGVAIGTFFASSVDGAILKRIFAIVTLFICVYMALGREKKTEPGVALLSKHLQHLICTVTGMLSSLIGVGGAILTVPTMSYSGIPIQRAIGTGAALNIAISFFATVGYFIGGFHHTEGLPPYSLGYVNVAAAALIIPVAILLTPLGARISHSMPRLALRRVFALLLALISLRMFMTL